jgi:hypothetical protein
MMTDPGKDDAGKQANNFAKYTGIAFQMLATIGLFTFIGYKIDENQSQNKSTYAALLGFLGVVVSLYMVIRSLTKKGNGR